MARAAVITGAYGYLGTLIRSRLEAAGWSTSALVRSPHSGDEAAMWNLGAPPPDEVLAKADALVHCAYDFAPRSREHVWRANVRGSAILIERARQVGVPRTLVLSSMSAYAGTSQVYGQAKLAIEQTCLANGGVAVRPGLVWGDAPRGMAGSLQKLTNLPVVPVIRGTHQFPVHEDDFARVILEILSAPTWTPEVFGVAQPQPVSFRVLLSSLAERAGRTCRFVPVPGWALYGTLRALEAVVPSFPMRSDSLIGLMRPASHVPLSAAFPSVLDSLRSLP